MHLTLTSSVQSSGRFFTRSNVRGYCFGFNGQMKDDEVYGEGNSYTAEYWQYDPRLGRRWNIDPVVKQYESPYACFGNNPIWFVDPTGADSTTYLYSELGADGKALYSPEQLQKIADVSKQIDEKNGITFTKYQVYATKAEFEKAISNGSENINELTDLVYSISDKTSGGWGFIQVGVTDASPTNYSGKSLFGGTLYMGSIMHSLKSSGVNEKYAFANAGIILAHERISHAYGIIVENMLGATKGSYGGNDVHASSGLSKREFFTPLSSSTYKVLRSTEIIGQNYKLVIQGLFKVAATGNRPIMTKNPTCPVSFSIEAAKRLFGILQSLPPL